MTKKDYQLIARAIKKHYNDNLDYYSDYEQNAKLSLLVAELAETLSKENSKFNKIKFCEACGYN
ncbi:MAG: hypothetical protein AABY22_03195 [Nanoarchaeota archaeon]